jgi:hypothetical protein
MQEHQNMNDQDAAQAQTWNKLHRRATLGAILLMGLLVTPFMLLLAWINWAIVFRGRNWSLDIAHPGIPEAATGLIAVVALAIFSRALVFWFLRRDP